jgi:hypothetical protein
MQAAGHYMPSSNCYGYNPETQLPDYCATCFPASARVTLADGSMKVGSHLQECSAVYCHAYAYPLVPFKESHHVAMCACHHTLQAMSDVAIGDVVQAIDRTTGALVHSEVYQIPHREPQRVAYYTRMTLASGAVLLASRNHYVYAVPRDEVNVDAAWRTRVALPAGRIVKGDRMWAALPANLSGSALPGHVLELSEVVDVGLVQATGVFAPFTMAGNLLVDGIAASSYVDMWGSEELMHRGAAFGRWTWQKLPMLAYMLDGAGFWRVWYAWGNAVALMLRFTAVTRAMLHHMRFALSSALAVVAKGRTVF